MNFIIFRSELCFCHCFQNTLLLYRLTVQSSLFALVFVLMAGVMISDRSNTHTAGPVTFLPDDAQIGAGPTFPNALGVLIGLISMPVNTALLMC